MKKLLLAAAGAALIASPAAAQSWGSATYGNDGAAHWALQSTVADFCKLGTSVTTRAGNSTVTPGDNGRGGTAANGDGTITFNIQNPTTNTIQASAAAMVYAQSQCNTTFNVTAESERDGLRNTAFGGAFGADFTDQVRYNVTALFGGNSGFRSNLSGTATLLANQQPAAGDFEIRVAVPANANRLLLAGQYTDFLKVTMAPVVSGPTPL
jgi:opacity protein-like surface antigen